MSGSLLVPFDTAPAPDTPLLLCLPPAGAGCGRYRHWQRVAGAAAWVVGVQLPGREARWCDPPAESVGAITGEVVEALCTGGSRPVVVYGHSFGGLLGYEVTRRLSGRGRAPSALVVAACRTPRRWAAVLPADFADGELLRLLRAGGVDPAALDEDTLELALEVLRADARLSRTFSMPADPVLHCPIHAWGGDADEVVTGAQLDEWREFGTAGVHRATFAGGHDFATDHLPEIVATLVGLAGPAGTHEAAQEDAGCGTRY